MHRDDEIGTGFRALPDLVVGREARCWRDAAPCSSAPWVVAAALLSTIRLCSAARGTGAGLPGQHSSAPAGKGQQHASSRPFGGAALPGERAGEAGSGSFAACSRLSPVLLLPAGSSSTTAVAACCRQRCPWTAAGSAFGARTALAAAARWLRLLRPLHAALVDEASGGVRTWQRCNGCRTALTRSRTERRRGHTAGPVPASPPAGA
ncbi:hypothetical protein ACFY2H_31560 [Streptomyces griseofuscus]|uniref:hypothetical protein n=1 Tax=Streptomyces griseofuscus TaxID=146922 RepID=UPI0036C43F0E